MVPHHLMRLPSHPWEIIISFLNEEEKAKLLPDLNRYRSRYDGSQFVFPVRLNKKRKTTEEDKDEGNVKKKRRRGGGEKENNVSTINTDLSSPADIPLPAIVISQQGEHQPFVPHGLVLHSQCRVIGGVL